jgi:ketosteroid isomerase-like protein
MKPERLKAADVAQIYKLWNEYSAGINSENLEHWIALWCKDGIQMPPDTPQRTGKDEIRKLEQIQFDKLERKLSVNPEVVHIFGELAYTHGTFISQVMPKNVEDKTTIRRTGKFLTILEKQGNGSWKILVDCFNYDSALE